MEHVGVVVDDLAAATAFFAELGLEPQSEGRSTALGSAAWWFSKASGSITR
jgi:catechol 2,3-dioxygenase-like lactoylglutathione lyase family enzyme